MLSDPIDLRVYLTDAEFRQRVLNSKAWAEYLKLPLIPAFDEDAARAEIEDRNRLRAINHLPLVDVGGEIAKLRDAYEETTFGDRFRTMSLNCIREIYGPLTPKDFNAHSAMVAFVAHKQGLIHDLIVRAAKG
jgi:hypothetical protein